MQIVANAVAFVSCLTDFDNTEMNYFYTNMMNLKKMYIVRNVAYIC